MAAVNLIMNGSVVSGIVGETPDLVIPEGVTAIAGGAFSNCNWLRTVTIESTVFRTIGERAFSGCGSLEKIRIKSLSGAISDFAFYKCSKLKTVFIPSGAMEIGSNAFAQCLDLSLVRIPQSVVVIAENAMCVQDSPRLLVVCDPETEASRFAKKHVIPVRGGERADEILLALETASRRRECLGDRIFTLFGQSIKVSNSLALWENISKYYSDQKDPLFNQVFAKIPKSYGGKRGKGKISQDFRQIAETAVKRLEKHGVFVTTDHMLAGAASLFESLNKVLEAVANIHSELDNMLTTHMDERWEQLQYEAESKVTGLSYGVIGDALTLALHAAEEFREKQKQRNAAYAVAQRQYSAELTQSSQQVDANYQKMLKENIMPAIRTITDKFVDIICATEKHYLVKHGLLEEVDTSCYDAKKSAQIISRALDADQEYSVGLALKLYPLNMQALIFAGENNLANDQLVDYIQHMGITGEHTVKAVLGSLKISLQRLLDYHARGEQTAASTAAISRRSQLIRNQLNMLANGRAGDASAQIYQDRIGKVITAAQWPAVCRIEPAVSGSLAEKLGFRPGEADTAEGYAQLGARIAAYNNRWTKAEAYATQIAASEASFSAKIKELYPYKGLLQGDVLSDLLKTDLMTMSNRLLKQKLPEYDGNNSAYVQKYIQKVIEVGLGTAMLPMMADMGLSVFMPGLNKSFSADAWVEGLSLQHIQNEQQRFAVELKEKLSTVKSYREAFTIANGYARKVDGETLASLMAVYVEQVSEHIQNLPKTIKIAEDVPESQVIATAEKQLLQLLDQESWKTYICASRKKHDCTPEEELKALIQSIKKTVLDHVRYTRGCTLLKKAKRVSDVEKARVEFRKLHAEYRDCRRKLQACLECEKELKKKKKTRLIVVSVAAVVLVAAVLVTVFAWIIPQGQYEDAEALLKAGKKAEAAMAFGKLGSYSDARQRSFALWDEIADRDTLSTGSGQTVGIKENGAVITAGENNWGEGDVTGWKDIIDVESETSFTVGLRSNGTVLITDDSRIKYSYQTKIVTSEWEDVVAITASNYAAVGLKSDGTLITSGANERNHLNVSDWENIISVACGSRHTVGLKADGTVIAVGDTRDGRCDVSAWTDIVAISAGDDYTVGLRADGTVVVAGSWDYDLSQWQDIVAISAGFTSVAGLKADGTVVSAGMNVRGECDTQSWTDIVAISVGDNAFGLKSDGTVVVAGDPEAYETRARNWEDIRTP